MCAQPCARRARLAWCPRRGSRHGRVRVSSIIVTRAGSAGACRRRVCDHARQAGTCMPIADRAGNRLPGLPARTRTALVITTMGLGGGARARARQENSGAGGSCAAGAASRSSSCHAVASVSPPALTSTCPPSAKASAVTAWRSRAWRQSHACSTPRASVCHADQAQQKAGGSDTVGRQACCRRAL